jgi:signal peptidase I
MSRARLRFRISTLLIVMTIVAAGSAFCVHRILRQPNYKLMHVGSSLAMAPTITREILAVDMHAYRLVKPARWDVVVLHSQEQPTGDYVAEILRVIGLPGETVSISDGKIVVDGYPVTQPQHLQSVRYSAGASDTQSELQPYTVPEGHYYLLGDNPAKAKDSRTLGGIPEPEIRGRVSGNR